VAVLLLVLALLAVSSVVPEDAAAHCGGGGVNHGSSQVPPPDDDLDCDFIKDDVDNCPPIGYDDIRTRNPGQEDTNGDGDGDWCDDDDDGDGIFDWTDHEIEYRSSRVKLDNCRLVENPDQEDENPRNGVGDACDFDTDRDGTFDTDDNCPLRENPDQADLDGDLYGDVCDGDDDGDYSRDTVDNCPRYPNPDQLDADQDGVGAVCDDDDTPPAPPPVPTAIPTPSATISATDRQPPRVTVSSRTSYRASEVADGLIVRIRCSEACTAKADVTVSKAVARSVRLRGTTVVGTGTARTEGATSTYAFVRFDARVRARLLRRARTVLTLKVVAADPAGNIRRETEHLVLRLG
jgi:hypothetical protein